MLGNRKDTRSEKRCLSPVLRKIVGFPTLVTGDPAVNLSTKRSIPDDPNAGVAFKHPLFSWGIRSGSQGGNDVEYGQQFFLELFRRDAIRIVRWRSESNWEVTKGNVEEGLCVTRSTLH